MTVLTVVCADDPALPAGDVLGDVVSLPELCVDPTQVSSIPIDADRAVLLLHRGAFDRASVQSAIRSIGIDPLGIQLLTIESYPDGESLRVAHAGAVARAAAVTESQPENVKLVASHTTSRRSFLRLPRPEYVAAPAIDRTTCVAGDGCRACVAVCPQEAYRWVEGRILFNKDACEPCGRCVTACPTGAIINPAVSADSLTAQVEAIVAASDDPVGVRFVCSRGESVHADGWYDVTVPCSSMVPGSWPLAALLLGAGAARAVPCGETGCTLAQDELAVEANSYARSILSWMGLDPDAVPGDDTDVPAPTLGGAPPLVDPFTTHGAVGVMLALAAAGEPAGVHEHPAADTGLVTINPDTCTLCTQCVPVCPTDALTSTMVEDVITLSFDAGRCTACAQCITMCPEIQRGAISVSRGVDLKALSGGSKVVNEGRVILCERCGKPVAPTQMMDRIADLLGDEFDQTMSYLNSRCMECRGS